VRRRILRQKKGRTEELLGKIPRLDSSVRSSSVRADRLDWPGRANVRRQPGAAEDPQTEEGKNGRTPWEDPSPGFFRSFFFCTSGSIGLAQVGEREATAWCGGGSSNRRREERKRGFFRSFFFCRSGSRGLARLGQRETTPLVRRQGSSNRRREERKNASGNAPLVGILPFFLLLCERIDRGWPGWANARRHPLGRRRILLGRRRILKQKKGRKEEGILPFFLLL
jgi:hypothetical protein